MIVEQSDADDSYTLHTVPGRSYGVNGPEIPIWGSMEIHLSVKDAQKSLPTEGVDGAVRLVRVADFTQLQAMLLPGKEFLRTGANLYVRVAKTCPAFYARWDSSDVVTHHELWSEVRRNKQSDPKLLWLDAENNPKTPIKFNIYRNIQSSSDGQAVLVRPGANAVQTSDSNHDDESDYDSKNDSDCDGGEEGGGSDASHASGSE